jgi:hypothetical protein
LPTGNGTEIESDDDSDDVSDNDNSTVVDEAMMVWGWIRTTGLG